MTESENPYASPETSSDVSVTADEATAREVFLAWEKLRLLYNGILASVVLIFGGSYLDRPPFLEQLGEGALGANIGYCMGPVAEGYLALLGLPRRGVRWFLFIVGTLFAIGLTFAVIAFHQAMWNA